MAKTKYGRAFAAIAGAPADAKGYPALVRATANFEALKAYFDELQSGAAAVPPPGKPAQG